MALTGQRTGARRTGSFLAGAQSAALHFHRSGVAAREQPGIILPIDEFYGGGYRRNTGRRLSRSLAGG